MCVHSYTYTNINACIYIDKFILIHEYVFTILYNFIHSVFAFTLFYSWTLAGKFSSCEGEGKHEEKILLLSFSVAIGGKKHS